MTKTEFLTDWDMLAIQESVRAMINVGTLNSNDGHVLLNKLESASHIRVSYKKQES